MIVTIAKQEFKSLCRDGRYRLTVALLLLLVLASGAFGWANYRDSVEQAEHAAEHDYQRWRNQDPTHPHNAAHYGSYAFKTPRPLTILDNGIAPYIGASVHYGAHQPHEMEFPPAQDATALQRFGDIGVAEVTKTLLPLLVILLSFGAFATEREQGILRQLLSLGVKPSALLWGKVLGIVAALLVVLLPIGVLGFLAASVLAPAELRPDEIQRTSLLFLTYTLYLGVFLFLSLAASARCRTARTALTIMLVFWVVTVFALPRGLLDLGAKLHPSPPADFEQNFAADMEKQAQANIDIFTQKILQKYNVPTIEAISVDITGLYMKSADEAGWPIIDRYFKQRFDSYRDQNRLLEWGGVVSPAAGFSLLSMALTGNDIEQHRDFVNQVEIHRRNMNTTLNEYMVQHPQKRGEEDQLKGNQALWEQTPLAGLWLILLVVLPGCLNLTLKQLYPSPSRMDYIDKVRAISVALEQQKSSLLGKYLSDHPDLLTGAKQANTDEFLHSTTIISDETERVFAPIKATFLEQYARQQAFVEQLRFLSPAIIYQHITHTLTGQDRARHQRFLDAAEAHHQALRTFFFPLINRDQATFDAYDAIPAFHFQELPLTGLVQSALVALLGVFAPSALLVCLGLWRLRKPLYELG